MPVFQWSLNYSQRCDGNVLSHRRCFPAATIQQIPILSAWCLQIKKNYNFKHYKMIWRRKVLTPAMFLIIMMKFFTGLSLTCHPAEYQIGNKCCPMCAAGNRVNTYCTGFRSTSCLPCLDGTYVDVPTDQQMCLPCTNCDAALGLKVKTLCTTTSDAVCEPLDGFYCTDSVGNNCVEAQKHRICHPGQYINQAGTASTDTVCSECSAGTFSDGTFTSCQPHTQCESINLWLIKPGTASTDAECGENSPKVAETVTICVLLFLLIAAGLVYFFHFRKKLFFSDQENTDEESSEPLKIIPSD